MIRCSMKRQDPPLTAWERRQISDYVRAICTGYNLEYLIVINKKANK